MGVCLTLAGNYKIGALLFVSICNYFQVPISNKDNKRFFKKPQSFLKVIILFKKLTHKVDQFHSSYTEPGTISK